MIDWTRLDELRADVGSDALHDVVAVFFEEMDATVAQLEASPDGAALADALHLLKGAAANLGLRGLSDLADTGEGRARSGQGVAEMPELLGRIRARYAADRDELRRALPPHSARASGS